MAIKPCATKTMSTSPRILGKAELAAYHIRLVCSYLNVLLLSGKVFPSLSTALHRRKLICGMALAHSFHLSGQRSAQKRQVPLRFASCSPAAMCFFVFVSLSVLAVVHAEQPLGIRFDPVTRSYSLDVKIEAEVPDISPICGESRNSSRSETLSLIKEAFINASRALHVSTRHHVHIGEVRFFLPSTWPRDLTTGELRCRSGTDAARKPAVAIKVFSTDKREDRVEHCLQASVPQGECGQPSLSPMTVPLATFLRCDVSADFLTY